MRIPPDRPRAHDPAPIEHGALIENLSDGVVLTRGGRIAYANRRLAEIFGYGSPDEMVGTTLARLRRGASWKGPLTTRMAPDAPRICTVSSSPVRDRSGRIVAIVALHREIGDERRAAEDAAG
ncbi:MAG: PAS domain-containing protein [Planctomycetes bacterium]|nr:PAS domain-containing protein [Planctomycetota bacterium]